MATVTTPDGKRNRYFPDSYALIFSDDETDLVVYGTTTEDGKVYGICFAGNKGNHEWHGRFTNEAARADYISETLKRRQEWKQRRTEERKQRKTYHHDLKVGDILYTSWGYDQTNVDYYQVVRTTPCTVDIRPIASDVTDTGFMQGSSLPIKDHFTGDVIRGKRVSPCGNGAGGVEPSIYMTSYSHAWRWDGRPRFCSWYA